MINIKLTEEDLEQVIESLSYHYDMTECQKEDINNKRIIMKAQKKFTTNERITNLEKALGELYFQFNTLLKAIKEDDEKESRQEN